MPDGTRRSTAVTRASASRRARGPVGGRRWVSILLLLSAPAVADNPNPAPVPLFTAIEATTPPPGAWQAWRVDINHEEICQPAAAIRVSIPGLPEFVREVSFWSPREGYIDAPNPKHPTGLQQIPDPTAPPEAFSWHWYAPHSISLTTHQGIAAGTVVLGARWFYISPRVGYTLLYEPSGSAGPPPPPRPVPGLAVPGTIVLVVLMLGRGLARRRRLAPQRRQDRIERGRPTSGRVDGLRPEPFERPRRRP